MKIIDKLALNFTSLICVDAYDNAKDRAKIQYGLTILLSEGFKIVFLVSFFYIIHNEKYFYYSLFVLLSTRVFAGGIHLKGTLNCLFLTTLLFSITSILAPSLPRFSNTLYLLIGSACFFIVLIRAPICSVRRPIKEKRKKLQYKFFAASAITIWTIVLLLQESTPYLNCGFSTILAQTIQLLLVKKPHICVD